DADSSQTLFQNEPRLQVDQHHLLLSGTSMATAVATGTVAVLLEANRDENPGRRNPPLTPNAVKAILQFTALRLHDDAGVEYDSLRQGAGGLNARGAAALAAALRTSAPLGTPRRTRAGDT